MLTRKIPRPTRSNPTFPRGYIATRRPQVGFVGVTPWLGRADLTAHMDRRNVDVAAVADTNPLTANSAAVAWGAQVTASPSELLSMSLDGVVVAGGAGPGALVMFAALKRGIAVLGDPGIVRSLTETSQVVNASRRANRLLALNFPLRYLAGMVLLRDTIRSGVLGNVFALEVACEAGGPCTCNSGPSDHSSVAWGLNDPYVHLVDLGLWLLDYPSPPWAAAEGSHSPSGPITSPSPGALTLTTMEIADGVNLRVTSSQRGGLGRLPRLEVGVFGSHGSAFTRNVDGSHCNFQTELRTGARREILDTANDSLGTQPLTAWLERLAAPGAGSFDQQAEQSITLARVLELPTRR